MNFSINFKGQKRILLLSTIITLVVISAIFTLFIHKNHERTRMKMIEDKLHGDATSILPHLYQSGNNAHFISSLEQYKKFGLPCLGVHGLNDETIWGDGNCSSKIESKNYIDQKVFDIIYTLPHTTILSTLKENGASFTVFFSLLMLFLLIAYKILSAINKRHSNTLVQIEHINSRNEANERVIRLTKTLGHNLKSPLAALKTLHELALDRLTEDETEILEAIQSNIDAMTDRLFDQKLESSPLATTNLSKKIYTIINVKKFEYSKSHLIKFESDIEEGLFALLNVDELKTIFSNIINNSIEARKINSTLTISILARKLHDKAIIRIKDDGHGVSDDVINRIFNYGFTLKAKGKGCGLAHAQETIKSWGGEIALRSELDRYTEVTITLPLMITKAIKEIVLIDDESLNLKYWKGMANSKKIAFKGYSSSAQFFANLPENKEEVAIYVDYELGEEDGLTVAQEILNLGYSNVTLATGEEKRIHPQIQQIGKEFPLLNSEVVL